MGQETRAEFYQRWVETAESGVRCAKRRFFLWFYSFIAAAILYFSAQELLPRSGWRTVAVLLLCAPFLICWVKMSTSASDLGDAKKFLRECRNGLADKKSGNLLIDRAYD